MNIFHNAIFPCGIVCLFQVKKTATMCSFLMKASRMKVSNLTRHVSMTKPIRNTGPCFHLSLPRQKGQRDVLSHTEFINVDILHALSLPGHPLRLMRKPPVMYPMSYKLVHAVVLSNDSLYVFVLVYIS